MTVWIVNPFDNLPTEGCRPQRYWLMAEAFVRAGHKVVYWTSDFSHARKAKREKSEKVGGESGWTADFEVVEIPTRPYPTNVCWARVRSHRQLARDFERMAHDRVSPVEAVSAVRQNGDAPLLKGCGGDAAPTGDAPALIIASTPPLGLCDAARRVAHVCGARFACDIQDAWPETFERLLPRGLKWFCALLFAPLRRTARRLYRESDLVTGVSARYGKLAGRDDFHLAYHGIEDANPARSASGSCRPTPAPEGRIRAPYGRHRLAYLGNLGSGYDLETVIDAVAQREDLTLDIAGLGPKERSLRARVASLGRADRVRFHGYLAEDAMQTLLASCDVGVIPMRDDSWVGLPYKLCDYLKAGLPVLSSLHGECGDLLTRTGFGAVYDFGAADSLLRGLDKLRPVPVSLPPELRAEEIYRNYVEFAVRNLEDNHHGLQIPDSSYE